MASSSVLARNECDQEEDLRWLERWAFREYLREPGDPVAVCFTVQTTDDSDFTGPLIRLMLALQRREPGQAAERVRRVGRHGVSAGDRPADVS